MAKQKGSINVLLVKYQVNVAFWSDPLLQKLSSCLANEEATGLAEGQSVSAP